MTEGLTDEEYFRLREAAEEGRIHDFRQESEDKTNSFRVFKNVNISDKVATLLDNPRDEYHSMRELYYYRLLYNALAANAMPDIAVKSWKHSDGEPCFGGGWFVVYLNLPTGQVSNHYKAGDWSLFQIPEVDVAPEYDGHTPETAARRLEKFLTDYKILFEEAQHGD